MVVDLQNNCSKEKSLIDNFAGILRASAVAVVYTPLYEYALQRMRRD